MEARLQASETENAALKAEMQALTNSTITHPTSVAPSPGSPPPVVRVNFNNGGTSIEMNIAVLGDPNPSLEIVSGGDSWTTPKSVMCTSGAPYRCATPAWQTLAENSLQFADRTYKLTGVPSALIGARYYMGQLTMSSASVNIVTTGHVIVWASMAVSPSLTSAPATYLTPTPTVETEFSGMKTGSFSGRDGFKVYSYVSL